MKTTYCVFKVYPKEMEGIFKLKCKQTNVDMYTCGYMWIYTSR